MKPLKKRTFTLVALLASCGCAFSLRTPHAVASADQTINADAPRYFDDYNAVATASASSIETFTFTTVEEECIRFANKVPYYYYDSTLSNACGPIAGAIVVGYFDKYYEDLIPNYTAYYTATGNYRLNDSTYVPTLINDLYTRMRTNVDDVGVSESDCLNGLTAYVYAQGRSISYNSVKPSSFSQTIYKNAMNNGQPVMLFCNSITTYDICVEDGETGVYPIQSAGSHIVIGYGYRKLTYYDENGTNFRTDVYLEVATGWTANRSGFVKANDTSWLDSGYAINIY